VGSGSQGGARQAGYGAPRAGRGPVRLYLARNVAKVATISVVDLKAGKYPEAETCPHCGRMPKEGSVVR